MRSTLWTLLESVHRLTSPLIGMAYLDLPIAANVTFVGQLDGFEVRFMIFIGYRRVMGAGLACFCVDFM